ncbi:hypothetical protein BDZ90DRAFT_262904 [Jaminaea rosea]|uniref:Uncharacterized protein n=1 Tax=Jaminaea rosea TaxID=1569628 RepID=A0A316UL87_9BASI|nr:hypothetical protein BDZ90DRAFT_262904 [Jaminaea rosea]PWN24683.1 hypothetical protein BDZ90DRAFT_262904 [Jaminaea rosea]
MTLPTMLHVNRSSPMLSAPELLDYFDYTRALEPPQPRRVRVVDSGVAGSPIAHQPSRIAARRALAPPPRPLDTSRATLQSQRRSDVQDRADSAALPDSGSPDPGCLHRWTCGVSSKSSRTHSRTTSSSSRAASNTPATTVIDTAAPSAAASVFCLPTTPAGAVPTGKMARVLGLSSPEQAQSGVSSAAAMLVAHAKREKALQTAPEDELPAFPCQRESLHPFKVMQDSVRKRGPRSLRRGTATQHRDSILSTSVWPSDLVPSPNVSPRIGAGGTAVLRSPSSMLHSFKHNDVDESERLVLTPESYATVPEDSGGVGVGGGGIETWALKIGGIELTRGGGAGQLTPTSAQIEAVGRKVDWVVHLRSAGERRAWQKTIQILVRELIKEERRFRTGSASFIKLASPPSASRGSGRESELPVSPPSFADEKVSLCTALGDADRIWQITTRERRPSERRPSSHTATYSRRPSGATTLDHRRPSAQTTVTAFKLQDPSCVEARPAVAYLHDDAHEEAQERLRDNHDPLTARTQPQSTPASRADFERTLGEYARSWDQWVTSRRHHPYASSGLKTSEIKTRETKTQATLVPPPLHRRSSASSYVDFLDLSPPLTPRRTKAGREEEDHEDEQLRAEVVESLMESTTPQRRRSSAVLDSPWSASTCSDSSTDTPFERSPITPATGSGAGEDFASHFVETSSGGRCGATQTIIARGSVAVAVAVEVSVSVSVFESQAGA